MKVKFFLFNSLSETNVSAQEKLINHWLEETKEEIEVRFITNSSCHMLLLYAVWYEEIGQADTDE